MPAAETEESSLADSAKTQRKGWPAQRFTVCTSLAGFKPSRIQGRVTNTHKNARTHSLDNEGRERL